MGRALKLRGFFACSLLLAAIMAPASAAESGAAAPAAQESAENPRFDVWEYQVEGNTLLNATEIERTVYGYLGEGKTIDDVTAAQRALEALYHGKGYGTVLVDIPEQDVEGGLVRLKVTEAPVSRLTVTGSRYFSLGRIKAGVPSLAVGKAPHLPTVQKELAQLANKSRDRTITPVLRPAPEPGRLEVDLKVEDELPVHGSMEVNDRFSADTSEIRVSGALRYDNLWQRGHSLGVSYLVSPEDTEEVEVVSANYLWRFEQLDHLLSLYAVRSNSNIATIGTLGVIGNGTISGLRYTIPAPALADYFHSVTLGLDYKDFGESIGLLGNDAINSPISYSMFNLNYGGSHFGERSRTRVDFTLNVAPRGLGNTEKEFERKRFRAKPNFVYATAFLEHEQRLFDPLRLFARVGGQVANSPLINNESYAAGGVNNVRAYLESEKQGDDAVNAVLELRYDLPRPEELGMLQGFEVFTFTDATGFRVKDPLPGATSEGLLWGTGLGFRLSAWRHLDAMLVWAMALRDSERTQSGDDRLHFNLGYQF